MEESDDDNFAGLSLTAQLGVPVAVLPTDLVYTPWHINTYGIW